MSWHFLQGQEVESSLDICWDGDAFAPSKSTTTLGTYCLRDSETDTCPDSRSGMTLQPSTGGHGEGESTLSAADFRARTSARLARARAYKASEAGCGLIWPESSARWDRDSCSWKIHPCLFPEAANVSSVTLPRTGMMVSGIVSALTTRVRPTGEKGSGAWPTIRASDGQRGGRGDLIQAVRGNPNSHYRLWQTPVADDALDRERGKINSRGEPKLSAQVKLWPTPIATEGKRGRPNPNGKHPYSLTLFQTIKQQNPVSNGGSLNPTWVEWLMGWPLGWTSMAPMPQATWDAWQSAFQIERSG